MYACVCFSITEEEIHDEISAGASTEEELGERCGAGTSCGTCVERLGCLIERVLSQKALPEKTPRDRTFAHSAEVHNNLAA